VVPSGGLRRNYANLLMLLSYCVPNFEMLLIDVAQEILVASYSVTRDSRANSISERTGAVRVKRK
jgi:hypothetical protein